MTDLGGGNSNIFYFHPYLGKISNLTNMFSNGLVQPPPSSSKRNQPTFIGFSSFFFEGVKCFCSFLLPGKVLFSENPRMKHSESHGFLESRTASRLPDSPGAVFVVVVKCKLAEPLSVIP